MVTSINIVILKSSVSVMVRVIIKLIDELTLITINTLLVVVFIIVTIIIIVKLTVIVILIVKLTGVLILKL